MMIGQQQHLQQHLGSELFSSLSRLVLGKAAMPYGLALALWAAMVGTSPALGQVYTDQQIKGLALEALQESPELVLQIIRENPEVITQAVSILREREQAQQAQIAQAALAANHNLLFNDPNGPMLGNPSGDVTIVEFFDYNCGYCRRNSKVIHDLLEGDKQVRVLLREWPILGEGSQFAARASLAAQQQDQYEAFHWALMALTSSATEASVISTAQELGLDVEQLRQDMAAPQVEEHLALSNQLARALQFTGTPAFVIGNTLVPGFMDLERLQELVEQSRSGELP